MHHQLSMLNSGSWLLSALVVFLVLAFAWFVIYNVIKKKDSDVSSEPNEEDMAKEFCPNLLSELIQLRREVKKLKGALDGQGSPSS